MAPLRGLFCLCTLQRNSSMRYGLGKTVRLKSRKIIEQLFKEGEVITISQLRILYLFSNEFPSTIKAGFAVSSRNFKKAVDRNRIRRLMKESFRLQKEIIEKQVEKNEKKIAIFFIYTGRDVPGFAGMKESILQALVRLTGSINEKFPKNS